MVGAAIPPRRDTPAPAAYAWHTAAFLYKSYDDKTDW